MAHSQRERPVPAVTLSEDNARLAQQVASLLHHRYGLPPQTAYAEASAMVASIAHRFSPNVAGASHYDNRVLGPGYTAEDRRTLEGALFERWTLHFRREPAGDLQRSDADSIAHDFLASQKFLPPLTVPTKVAAGAPLERAPAPQAPVEQVYRYQVRMGVGEYSRTYIVELDRQMETGSLLSENAENFLRNLPDSARVTQITESRDERGRRVIDLEDTTARDFRRSVPGQGDPLGQIEVARVEPQPERKRRQG